MCSGGGVRGGDWERQPPLLRVRRYGQYRVANVDIRGVVLLGPTLHSHD